MLCNTCDRVRPAEGKYACGSRTVFALLYVPASENYKSRSRSGADPSLSAPHLFYILKPQTA